MAKRGKRYNDISQKVDKMKIYTPEEALDLVFDTKSAKFVETVELAIRLGVDPRHADQQVRGTVSLPNGTGKTVRVAVIAKDAKADTTQAKAAKEALAKFQGTLNNVDALTKTIYKKAIGENTDKAGVDLNPTSQIKPAEALAKLWDASDKKLTGGEIAAYAKKAHEDIFTNGKLKFDDISKAFDEGVRPSTATLALFPEPMVLTHTTSPDLSWMACENV